MLGLITGIKITNKQSGIKVLVRYSAACNLSLAWGNTISKQNKNPTKMCTGAYLHLLPHKEIARWHHLWENEPHKAPNLKTPDCLILKLLASKTSIHHLYTTSYMMFIVDRKEQSNSCDFVPTKDNLKQICSMPRRLKHAECRVGLWSRSLQEESSQVTLADLGLLFACNSWANKSGMQYPGKRREYLQQYMMCSNFFSVKAIQWSQWCLGYNTLDRVVSAVVWNKVCTEKYPPILYILPWPWATNWVGWGS